MEKHLSNSTSANRAQKRSRRTSVSVDDLRAADSVPLDRDRLDNVVTVQDFHLANARTRRLNWDSNPSGSPISRIQSNVGTLYRRGLLGQVGDNT